MRETVKDFLDKLGREAIERVYQMEGAQPWTAAADEKAAERLTVLARVEGLRIQITPATLRRYRSRIGMVRTAARETPTPPAPPSEPLLPGFGESPAALPVLRDLVEAVHGCRKQAALIARALWAIYPVLAHQAGAAPVAKPNGPEAATEAVQEPM